MSILYGLLISRDYCIPADSCFSDADVFSYNNRRIEKALEYIQARSDKPISLSEAARLTNLRESAFRRFFRLST